MSNHVFDEEKLKEIQEELKKRKRDLEEVLSNRSREQFSDGQVQDPGDQAMSSTMESLRVSLQGTEQQEYDRLVKALEMIDAGSYGICEDCENQIKEKRLNYYPNATRCLSCQEAYEEHQGEF